MTTANEIRMQVMWNRLISVVEEQARTMVRAAFSPAVREGGDLSAGVFDTAGRMLAQAVTGTPGHVNTMATAVQHFLDRYPIEDMCPGDILITNDPWLASGHLHDVTIVSPAFHAGRPVGVFAATVHIVDVGGRGMGPDGTSVYEEGVLIPIMPLARKGVLNDDLLTILLANSREPFQVCGDIMAIMAAGQEGSRRLSVLLSEFGTADLHEIADFVISRTRAATLKAIAELTPGQYCASMTIDGYDEPIKLVAAMTVASDGVSVDFAGSSAQSSYGINVVETYTRAYSTYGLMCAIAPGVPNNDGALGCFSISAPYGSILNAHRPAPVSARHIVGHALPDVVFGCLAQVMPRRVPAESGMMWNPYVRGTVSGRPFELFLFNAGGMGASASADGLSATAFPSGISNIPVEAAESVAPVLFHRKELRPDSGGAGRWRGGLGQVVEIGPAPGAEAFGMSAMFDRIAHPAAGRAGGLAGAAGSITFSDGHVGRAKGFQVIEAGRTVTLELPGGGGFGPPSERDPARIIADIADGLVSHEAVRRDYGFDTEGLS